MKSLNKQWGISLVEVMVALMLSLFLLAGIVQVYIGNKATFSFTNALAELQENGRYALDLMSQDLRLAGVWGCIPYDPSDTNNINDTLGAPFKDQDGVMGTEGGIAGGVISPDTLTIRGGKPGQANVRSPFTAASSNKITTNLFNSIAAGDVILVARCGKNDLSEATPEADILTVTGVTQNANNTVITHTAGKSQQFGNDAIVLELQDVTYSIAASDSGEAGATSLFRQEFAAAPQELVEGVENLQVLYGIDTSGDQYANQYVTAAQPGLDFDNVVSIRLQLLLRSLDDFVADAPQVYTFAGTDFTAADRRIRQVFTATIALRNRIGSPR